MGFQRLAGLVIVYLYVYAAITPACAATMYRRDSVHSGSYAGTHGEYFAGVRWRYQTGGAVRSSPAIDAGTAYVGSSDAHLYALDANTGTLRWSFDAKSAVTSSPAVDNARVYFEAHDGTIYALKRSNGKLAWRVRTGKEMPLPWGYESGDFWTSSPAIDGRTLFIGAGDGALYAIDSTTGSVRWKTQTGGRIRSSPAVANATVYVGSYDGKLYAFNASTGAVRWRFATEGASLNSGDFGYDRRSIQSSPSLGAGAVFFGSKDGSIYAVEQSNGRERWRHKAQVYWYMSAPAFHDGVVFTGNSDARFVQALDAATGAPRWTFDTGINVFASPALSGGTVYCGAWDGVFYAIDERSGNLLWKFTTLGRRIFSSAAVQGTEVLFGADDGGVYALDVAQAPVLRRAVFYDATLEPFNAVPRAADLRDFLKARGYGVVDRNSLQTFLETPIAHGQRASIVFAMDVIPPALWSGEDPLLRRYLRSGGKAVWVGNPPLIWGQTELAKRTLADLDRRRPKQLLGVGFERGNFDPMTATPTVQGRHWGLADPWLSNWSADASTVTTVLALDEQGQAAAWVRSFGGPPASGFVDIPMIVSPQGYPQNLMSIALASDYFPA